MPVNPQFIELTAGEWTQICDYRDLRKSLLVCCLGADCVLSTTTNTPDVTGPAGSTPAGIYLEGGSNGVPTIFRMSSEIDDDLVRQAWFAQASGGGGGAQVAFSAGAVATQAAYTIPVAAGPAGIIVLWECGIYTVGPGPSVVTTTGAGTPVRVPGNNITDGVVSARPSLWYWVTDGLGETITVTGTGVADYLWTFAVLPATAVIDRTVTLSTSGSQWTVTIPLLAHGGDWAASGIVAYQSTVSWNEAEAGFFDQGASVTPTPGQIAEGANTWYIEAVSQQIGAASAVPVIWTQLFGTTAVGVSAFGAAWLIAAPTVPPIISVFEAFDLPAPPPDPRIITVGLPQLSPAGKEHLRRLQELVSGSTKNDVSTVPEPAQELLGQAGADGQTGIPPE